MFKKLHEENNPQISVLWILNSVLNTLFITNTACALGGNPDSELAIELEIISQISKTKEQVGFDLKFANDPPYIPKVPAMPLKLRVYRVLTPKDIPQVALTILKDFHNCVGRKRPNNVRIKIPGLNDEEFM